MRDILTDMSIERQMSLSVPEHQTLLSWCDDEQNEQFEYWLCTVGLAQFKEWYVNQHEGIECDTHKKR